MSRVTLVKFACKRILINTKFDVAIMHAQVYQRYVEMCTKIISVIILISY